MICTPESKGERGGGVCVYVCVWGGPIRTAARVSDERGLQNYSEL